MSCFTCVVKGGVANVAGKSLIAPAASMRTLNAQDLSFCVACIISQQPMSDNELTKRHCLISCNAADARLSSIRDKLALKDWRPHD